MITELDPADERTSHAAWQVIARSRAEDREWLPIEPFDQWRDEVVEPDPAEDVTHHISWDDGVPAGVGVLELPHSDNTGLAWCHVEVDPAYRRRGHGRALLTRLTELATAAGRERMLAPALRSSDPRRPGGHDVALAMGWAPGWDTVVSVLDLPVPRDTVDRLAATTAGASDGYRIRSWTGGVDPAYLQGMCDLVNLLDLDAPSGDVEFEAESHSPERMREYYDRDQRHGRTRLSALAVERGSGLVVAMSDLLVPAAGGTLTEQHATYVHRDHRGHRLGVAVKLATLELLARDHPGQRRIRTFNAAQNEHMMAVNRSFGFRRVATSSIVQRVLPGPAGRPSPADRSSVAT